MAGKPRIFTGGFWKEVRSQMIGLFIGLSWPTFAVTVTAFTGYVEHFELAAIITLCSIVMFFTMGFILLVKLYLWIETPENKWRINSIQVSKLYTKGKVTGIKYGVNWQNIAWFPIEYHMGHPIQVSLGGNINPNPGREFLGHVCQLGATGIFWEAEIPMTPTSRHGLQEGIFEFEVKYGKPGNLKFSYHKKFKVYVKFNTQGDIESYEVSEY